MKLTIVFNMDLPTGANVRRGTREYMNRVKRHREAGKFWTTHYAQTKKVTPRLPCTITLTRYSTRKLDGHDGLPNAFKHIVDGIACKPTRLRPAGFFEVDDADERFTWVYKQEIMKKSELNALPGQSRVKIELEWNE